MPLVTDNLQKRVSRDVWDDERLSARKHLLDLGVVDEIDGQITQLLVVARCNDVSDVARFPNDDDAHAVDPSNLRDALNYGEKDPPKVEVARERSSQLENEASVVFFSRKRLDETVGSELPTHARDELDGLEGLAHEVVGSCGERLCDLLVSLKGGEHDYWKVTRLESRAERSEYLVAIGLRHDEIEQHDGGSDLLDLVQGFGARTNGHVRELRCGERLNEGMSADAVVIDNEDGAS